MPYDGQNYVPLTETKADPFSLESLVAWLETQDPAVVYCYYSNGDCLLARYFAACGLTHVSAGGITIDFTDGRSGRQNKTLPRDLANLAAWPPHTFEGALHRARTILAARAGI